MRGVLIAQIALLVLVVVLPLVVALVGWIGTGYPFGAYAGNIVAIVLGIMVSAAHAPPDQHCAFAAAFGTVVSFRNSSDTLPSHRPRRPWWRSCT